MKLSRLLPMLLVIAGALCAQEPSAANGSASTETAVRPLTWEEGADIIQSARDNRSQIDPEQDCSHLVHDIYELAGLYYPYAPSTELYRGVESFERVRVPQPGDLIVWRGHVGVVVDPAEHSFYSALSTGPKIDTYDSPTWRSRGPAHFFRYLLHAGERVRSATTAAMADGPVRSESEPPADAPRTSIKKQQSSPDSDSTEFVLLNRERPTKAALQEALLQLWSNASDERQDQWQEAADIVIVQSFKVERVQVRGNTATLNVKVRSAGRLTADETNARASTLALRLRLVRNKAGWRIEDSSGRMYLAGNAAVAAISDRLSGIARENASRSEQIQTANLLRGILK